MSNASDIIPSEPAELRAFTVGLLAELKNRDLLIEKLRHQVAGQNTHRFGSKAEGIDQLQLRFEDEEVAVAAAAPLDQPTEVEADTKAKPKRKPLPDHLPRVEQVLSVGDACTDCGGALRELGRDTTDELEYVPGRFVVNQIIRPRMACKACDCISQAPLPSRPIEKGIPGPGFLAHVLISKYMDHLPLYRQAQIFAREGLDIDRSTLAGWVGKAAALLHPLAEAIKRYVLKGLRPSLQMIRLSRCWPPAMAEPRQLASGPTGEMNALGAAMLRQLLGMPSRRIARAFAPAST